MRYISFIFDYLCVISYNYLCIYELYLIKGLKMGNSARIRELLENDLNEFMALKSRQPSKGWIRSIRQALGMSGRQLAARIEVDTSRISEMEKAETHGNITLKSLRSAAEAMECELVYAFVPKTSLESSLRAQAKIAAGEINKSVGHSMRLEDQGLSPESEAKQFEKLVDKWIKDPPRWLWNKK
jgi:predicted DNA-binding mobile mystery protein A